MNEPIIFWGTSSRMKELERDATFVAPTPATVLITGPSGSGKEVIARFIHTKSVVKGEFIAINCAAIPENLLESLLFGHERGVFTGAFDRQIGLFERASGGTLFLDEIGTMAPLLQAKLLRVLQEMEFQRLGGHVKISLNARVIAATNENLDKAIADGRFREDLFYRIAVFPLAVPSLKARLEDVPKLFSYFIQKMRERYERPAIEIGAGLCTRLKNYDWPGNIRELKNAAEYAFLRVQTSTLELEHLPPRIQACLNRETAPTDSDRGSTEPIVPGLLRHGFEVPHGGLRALVRDFERQVITDVLKRHGGVLNRAYKELGIPKPTLIQRTRLLNIDVNRIKYEASR